MTAPLNPVLYESLKEAFGHVDIVNQGEPIRLRHRPNWGHRNGRLKAEVVDWGETYKVSCPFCNDTRKRLYINHHWADVDERTGDDMLHLATCFNESCLKTREAQKDLHAMVYPRGKHGRGRKVQLPPPSPASAPVPPKRFLLPDGVPLAKLPEDHPAIQYLRRRKFDPLRLARRWGVIYCPANPERHDREEHNHPYFYHPRIVYPVFAPLSPVEDETHAAARGVRLAGWQARALEDEPADGAPKYFSASGMKKNELLYGLPRAIRSTGPVVVVEGVTDVWRLRTNAVALFGKTISPSQCKLLLRHCGGRQIVILLDRDAEDEAIHVYEKIASNRLAAGDDSPVIIAGLPRGRKDPGECTYKEVWKAVKTAMKHRL